MAIGRRSFLTGAGLLLAGGPRPALAQSAWPTRPVRFIVPLAAGGAMDFAARQCGVVLSRNIGQQVFVENRTGAGGTIGMDAAMKSAPDGYTFLVTNDNAAIAPHILNLAYDFTKEIAPGNPHPPAARRLCGASLPRRQIDRRPGESREAQSRARCRQL